MSRREQRGDYRSPAWTGGEWLAARLKLLDPDRAGRRAGAQTVPPLQIDSTIDVALLTAASRWPTLAKIAPSCLTITSCSGPGGLPLSARWARRRLMAP